MKKTWIWFGVVLGILLVLFVATKIHFGRAREKGRPIVLEQIQMAEVQLVESYADLKREYPDWPTSDREADSGLALRIDMLATARAGYQQLVALHDELLNPDYAIPVPVQDILNRVEVLPTPAD